MQIGRFHNCLYLASKFASVHEFQSSNIHCLALINYYTIFLPEHDMFQAFLHLYVLSRPSLEFAAAVGLFVQCIALEWLRVAKQLFLLVGFSAGSVVVICSCIAFIKWFGYRTVSVCIPQLMKQVESTDIVFAHAQVFSCTLLEPYKHIFVQFNDSCSIVWSKNSIQFSFLKVVYFRV